MQERADELVESWINGNRKFVIDEIVGERNKPRAALLSALVFSQLDGERPLFLRMLKEKL